MKDLKYLLGQEYNKIYDIALKITKGNTNDAKDLTQEVYVILLEYDQDKLQSIYDNGHISYWVARVMLNQYTRANSNFKTKYYTYLRTENYEVKNFEYFDDIDWHKEKENKLQFLNDKLSNLHEYDKLLFQLYYSTGKSIRKLSKESGISVTSIYNTLRNVKNYLKDEVESEYKELQ